MVVEELELFNHNNLEIKLNLPIDKENFKPIYRQLLVISVILIDVITNGVLISYSATLIPELQSPKSVIQITKDDATWIAAIAVLPLAPACALGGWTLEKFGRKGTYQLATLINAIGWILIATATNIECLYVGRFITGIAAGLTTSISNLFSGEIATPKYRSAFLCCPAIGLSFGPLLCHLLALFTQWQVTAYLTTIIAFIAFLITLKTKESYIWYLNRRNFNEAEKSFFWYRGYNKESINEYKTIIYDYHHQVVEEKRSFKKIFNELTSKRFLKPLLITNVFFLTAQWSGNKAVIFYSITIINKMNPTMNEYVITIILDVIRFLTACLACLVINKCMVRSLTMFSGIGASISLYVLAGFVYLTNLYPSNQYFIGITLISLFSFIGIISIGILPLPFVIYGELYPKQTKGIGAGSTLFFYMFMLFVIIRISPEMFDSLGISCSFVIYASLALLGTVMLYFILPETKNKTLIEIEKGFDDKKQFNL